jgi:hypothetical protein
MPRGSPFRARADLCVGEGRRNSLVPPLQNALQPVRETPGPQPPPPHAATRSARPKENNQGNQCSEDRVFMEIDLHLSRHY